MKKNIFLGFVLMVSIPLYGMRYDADGMLILPGYSAAKLVLSPELASQIKEEVYDSAYIKLQSSLPKKLLTIIAENQAINEAYNEILMSTTSGQKQQALEAFNKVIDDHVPRKK